MMIMTVMLLVSVIMVMMVVRMMMTTLLVSVVIEMGTIPNKLIMIQNFETQCEILLQIIEIKMLSTPNTLKILKPPLC